MKRTLTKTAALAAAALLSLVLFTGCLGNLYDNVMTIDGHEISSGLYLAVQYEVYTEAENMAEDKEKDILKQQVEGVPAADWIRAETMRRCREFVAVERLCREKEIYLNRDNQSYLDQAMQYYDMSADSYAKNGIGRQSVKTLMANEMLNDQLFEAMYAEDGELAHPDEEMKREYTDQYANIKYEMLPVKNLTTDETKTEEVQAVAEGMVKRLEAGEDWDTVTAEGLEEVYAMLGRDYDPETTASSSQSTSYISYTPDEAGTYTPEFLAQLKAQQEGDYGVCPMSSIILVYEKIPTFADDAAYEGMRTQVAKSMYREEYDAHLAAIYDAYPVNEVFGAVQYFSPGKIV